MLAIGVPALLLAGAYIGQYGFGLYPCEMCWWQRYPHFAAVILGIMGTFVAPRRLWIAFAALAIMASGVIGGFHAGVEYGWWQGPTACSNLTAGAADPLQAIMTAPLVRCDQVAWSLFGISLAGWNFIVSLLSGLAIFSLLMRKENA
ncbi:disulfide bond formation protein B [Altererythrobacter endophyticus]|uniref:Disulfide bond formation protein B n=2 Tax=Altericroceibacterium endophyticum TaxID=1808508 RepID=A0A6I4T773_9SPHN|nr:disulfide bond formation protein B [Altericroceibacterium endophyticum]MXO65695.1 disulfide bond formation protein B [Altericroceibacterium endophyticum]